LKAQGWKYHKKYLTWFKHTEGELEKTETYEQGTYAYFDYEKDWTQRVKNDFKFDYAFREDSI
jgi:CCR4-NOT transcription complex subunit 3